MLRPIGSASSRFRRRSAPGPDRTGRIHLLFVALLAGSAGACAGAPEAKAPLPIEVTKLDPPLASHRCAPGARACVCRGPGDPLETEPVPGGLHRFELIIYNNVRPEAAMRIPGLPYELHPSGESPAAECWYVDLEPGIHPITYRIAPADGRHVRLGLQLFRYAVVDGPEGPEPHWYPVLDVKCGEGGDECTPDELRGWLDRFRADPKATYDLCGNAELHSPNWEGTVPPRDEAYDDLEFRYELLVMKPRPKFPPCGKGPPPTE